MTLTVGQKLYWVPFDGHHHQEGEVTVLSVGRRWAKLSNQSRIEIETLRGDAGHYAVPGRCWLSKQDYMQATRAEAAWTALWKQFDRHRRPECVTYEHILAAAQLLGLTLEGR